MTVQPAQTAKLGKPQALGSIVACAALLLLFGVISWFAVLTKSPTMDEPLHSTGAYLHVFHHDYRINPEDPPLWNYWAMLPHQRGELNIDPNDEVFVKALEDIDFEAMYSVKGLFLTPGVAGDRFIDSTRLMMLVLGVILGGIIAWWGHRLGGALSGIIATALFCFDPNFMAHAPLVKNDVPISLCFLAITMVAWSVGRRIRWWNLPLLMLLCGVAVSVKFSGILVLPMVLLLLVGRAILRTPWIVLGREIRSIGASIAVAIGAVFAASAMSVLVIWASYAFRTDPTPTPDIRLDIQSLVTAAKQRVFFLQHDQRYPTEDELAAMREPLLVRAALFADRHRLLPQAYVFGFVFTYQSSLVRNAFLMGEHSLVGWWYYFPLAMLFKTPLATLAAILLVPFMLTMRKRNAGIPATGFDHRWTSICLIIPIIVYGASALKTNLNLGLRHVLPLYPFIYLLLARATATIFHAIKPITLVLGSALIIETLVAFPDYIPFFNAIFQPYRLHLLSDSNLDWGQDLIELAHWQEQHPTTLLYLACFGSTPPKYYGINSIKAPGGYFLEKEWEWPERPGVLAISATILQGTGLPPSLKQYYAPLRQMKPREILGGSIYLYDVPQPPLPRPAARQSSAAQSQP